MDKKRILKIISGLCVGLGVGVCFGIAMDNVITGLLLGLGVGMCYAVAFTSNYDKEKDKSEEKESDSKKETDD